VDGDAGEGTAGNKAAAACSPESQHTLACVSIRQHTSNRKCSYTTLKRQAIACHAIYVCMYACIHICMYVYIYIYIYVHTYVCMYVCMHVCAYTYIYVHMYVRMYVCMHACVCVCVCIYIRMYMGIRIHVCMYVCMHTRTYRLTRQRAGRRRKGCGRLLPQHTSAYVSIRQHTSAEA